VADIALDPLIELQLGAWSAARLDPGQNRTIDMRVSSIECLPRRELG